jgi:hypothetical protein
MAIMGACFAFLSFSSVEEKVAEGRMRRILGVAAASSPPLRGPSPPPRRGTKT